MSKENLERVLDTASERDWKVASQAWWRYQKIVGAIAAKNGYPMFMGAAVFAALSPNSDYLGNIRDTNRLLAAARSGVGLDDFKVSTYGANKLKAWRIVHGEKPLDLIIAPKTRNFFLNVLDPNDPVPVTVDGHIFNAWKGQRLRLNSSEMKQFSKYYEEVAENIRQLGAERQAIPNVIQGVLWYCWKRINRILYSEQMRFWGDDFQVAGLGFEADW